MGQFAEVLHIRPWEIELLTVQDFDILEQFISDRNEAIRKAADNGGS
jgi:hypothetical protein